MKYKYYVITLSSEIDYRELKKFHKKLTAVKGILGWLHYIVGTYIVKVASNVIAGHIMEIASEMLPKNTLFFVVEINLDNFSGIVTKTAKDWLDDEKKNNELGSLIEMA